MLFLRKTRPIAITRLILPTLQHLTFPMETVATEEPALHRAAASHLPPMRGSVLVAILY